MERSSCGGFRSQLAAVDEQFAAPAVAQDEAGVGAPRFVIRCWTGREPCRSRKACAGAGDGDRVAGMHRILLRECRCKFGRRSVDLEKVRLLAREMRRSPVPRVPQHHAARQIDAPRAIRIARIIDPRSGSVAGCECDDREHQKQQADACIRSGRALALPKSSRARGSFRRRRWSNSFKHSKHLSPAEPATVMT